VEQDDGEVWSVYRGDERLADLVVTGGDFPWLEAQVRARAAFEDVRPLFIEELRRLDRIDDDVDAWEAAYAAVRAAVTLHYPQGGEVPEFLLHVDGETAWWRWSDEPNEV
jgi:hypothetical protein